MVSGDKEVRGYRIARSQKEESSFRLMLGENQAWKPNYPLPICVSGVATQNPDGTEGSVSLEFM